MVQSPSQCTQDSKYHDAYFSALQGRDKRICDDYDEKNIRRMTSQQLVFQTINQNISMKKWAHRVFTFFYACKVALYLG